MWHCGTWIHSPFLSPLLVWSTPLGLPGRCGICIHQHLTTGIRRRRRWHNTYWHMVQCEGVGWFLLWLALMTKFMIQGREVWQWSEVWTMNICSLGFWDIKEVDVTELRVYWYLSAFLYYRWFSSSVWIFWKWSDISRTLTGSFVATSFSFSLFGSNYYVLHVAIAFESINFHPNNISTQNMILSVRDTKYEHYTKYH